MRKAKYFIGIFLVICYFLMCSKTIFAENLIIVGFDGVSKSTIEKQQNNLPGIKKIQQTGGKISPLFIEGFTLTVPAWTEFFTGLSFDQTGVIGNNKFDIVQPNLKNGEIEYDSIHKVFRGISFWTTQVNPEWTLMNKFQNKGFQVFWNASKSYLSKDSIMSPLAEAIQEINIVKIYEPKIEGDSYLDILEFYAINQIKTAKRNNQDYIMFFHCNPDYYAHNYGGNSNRHLEEITRCDSALENIFKIADKTNTQFLVLSDHGFEDKGRTHLNSENSWFITTLPIYDDYSTNPRVQARMRDLTKTIIDYYKLSTNDLDPRMRGISMLNNY